MTSQMSLDDYPVSNPLVVGHVVHDVPIEDAFWEFHRHNPHVYAELVSLAGRAVNAGAAKIGIGMLFEVLRWRHTLRTGGDEFKLNNNYRSYYARLIMLHEPDLAGVFETRKLHAGKDSLNAS